MCLLAQWGSHIWSISQVVVPLSILSQPPFCVIDPAELSAASEVRMEACKTPFTNHTGAQSWPRPTILHCLIAGVHLNQDLPEVMSAWLPARRVICCLLYLCSPECLDSAGVKEGHQVCYRIVGCFFFSPLVEETLVCPG